jgi:acetolactate synthase-1/3 small subunit
MTIVVDTRRTPAELVAANLRKLVPVVEVNDVTHLPTVNRDLALVRVACGPAERSQIADVIAIFRARIVDVAAGSVIVEVTGDVDKVDGLVDLLRPRGILEMVRTGKVAMVRGAATATTTDGHGHGHGHGNGNGNGNDATEAQSTQRTE